MDTSNRTVMIVGIVALVLIVGGLVYANNAPSKYDGFAMCLKDKGATFYGAFWCPHCAKQKSMFGNAKKYLPYVECSTPDANGQTPICIEKEIHSYPTWIFPDMSSTTGEQELSVLADKTGCTLPN